MFHVWSSARSIRSCADQRSHRGIALVVDGDHVFRHFAMRTLHDIGCATVGLNNAEEALRWLDAAASAPALISCETELARTDGFELCRVVRSHVKMAVAVAPILCVSSATESNYRTRALESGADVFLEKPVRPERFLDAARGLLRSRNDTRAKATSWIRDRGMS